MCLFRGPPLTRCYSSPPQRKGFFGQVFENIKQEMVQSKEMKESLKKFREEAAKLEQSEALRSARQKYENIEAETAKGSQQIKEQLESLKEKIREGIEEAQKSEIGKMSREFTEELAKSAKTAAETLAKQGDQLGKSGAFQAVSSGIKAVKTEIDVSTIPGARVYRAPEKLRKRSESSSASAAEPREVSPNEEATGIELHKDSRWYQSWQNFRENNPYVHKFFDLKTQYDESDNPLVRASRTLTDKVSDIFGGLFQKTELSEVLTEICKMDPAFDKNEFLRQCETDIIPNVLEAIVRGDLEILRDWCHDAPFNVLSTPIKQAAQLGYRFDSKVLDVTNVDLAMGKIMEQGPVLIITFQSQQIMVVRNAKGDVVEGDPEKIMRMHYAWVLCRDQNELDPRAAWKLMDLSANSAEQWL
ncbi:mitochondrial import inner membrane translocase, subunit TIM44, putative [Ixodes scapularis]|uniref:Mitochondrial import inner membrane translocase subunit TIM44 n=1 Tax=Ixodes scapularis TaxID=6945 RepID=B7QIK5_IXOSC|nr:mitochondrial import inner membrane translocase, subunit TIM44, putative [Ixodes scapularis]|eukprot:XP_002415012.1 mitochondrial import inner membrane translocase, subunit TIM44, putative [Ixodes scapularis]